MVRIVTQIKGGIRISVSVSEKNRKNIMCAKKIIFGQNAVMKMGNI